MILPCLKILQGTFLGHPVRNWVKLLDSIQVTLINSNLKFLEYPFTWKTVRSAITKESKFASGVPSGKLKAPPKS